MKRIVYAFLILAVLAGCRKPQNGPDAPGQNDNVPVSALVKSIEVTTDGEPMFAFGFTYDDESRVSNIEWTLQGTENMVIPVEISYLDGKVSISEKAYGELRYKYDADLDAQGRVSVLSESEYGRKMDISYDDKGYMDEIKVSESWNGKAYSLGFNYSGDNLSRIDINESEAEDYVDLYYSGYANNLNIDINWLLTFERGIFQDLESGLPWYGVIGLTGSRDRDLAVPGFRYNPVPATASPAVEDSYVPEGRLGETVEVECSTTVLEYDDENFRCDVSLNENGTLRSITASVPQYTLTFRCTGTLEASRFDKEEGGVKYYYTTVKVTGAELIKKEAARKSVVSASVTYF